MKKQEKNGNTISIIGKQETRGLVWDDTRAFLAVARQGTLSGAAGVLGLGVATLSRRIDRLEGVLSLPLFLRHQSGYQLTEDGTNLLEKAEALETAALAFSSDAATRAEIAGRVRLATAENLATGLILPALPRLQKQYPNLLVEITTDINTVNLHRRDADLAVRMVKPERGHVTIRRLGTLGFGLYCHPDYAATRSHVSDAGNFDSDHFISWSEMQAYLPAAQWIERVLQGRQPILTTTSLSTQIAAAKAGIGLAVLPHFLANNAGLVCVASDLGIDQPIWLVIQSDLAQSPRTRVVANFLTELVLNNRDKLAG